MALITLTTDFGTRDPYVAQLKAVLYAGSPSGTQVVDLSHELPAQNVREAALFVEAALPRFPAGTIHVVVIDPGVGSARRPIAVRARGQVCVGPDNGVLSQLFDAELSAVELDPTRLGVAQLSATFHGRDLFAPAAAALASGRPLAELGRTLDPRSAELKVADLPKPTREGAGLVGEVLQIDRFGNLITNLATADLEAFMREAPARSYAITLRAKSCRLVNHYAEVPEGCLLALVGSAQRLEVAARNASAAELLSARLGDRVRLESV
ncbi:MAG TPA: SAM-dependent chlorinase/fluorinase [Polyangiales bacterium]|nr:SAM-dependent chlorinase/fluorinase [Polyangiales bacterium]